jgi:glutamate-1-semialdehyde 2,1-aminomutase
MNIKYSLAYFREAQKYLPGGVDSPVRAFKAVGGNPLFIVSGKGSKIQDVDGNKYIDYVCSWGPLILGHAHRQIVESLLKAVRRGTSFGAPNVLETILARKIVEAIPSIEIIRFVNSGTEAVMSALRLARAFTGRDKIVKFSGCYHGNSDGLLAMSGSGLTTLGIPESPGVPRSFAQQTLIATYNNLQSVKKLFVKFPDSIAAIIIEPIAANMGVVLPQPGFLQGLRDLCTEYKTLLIFDEVITGFRVSYGGAQSVYKVIPDITCLGKIIGGGLPVGAYGGRKDIMSMIAPSGKVYQAGTLSGNPIAMTAGIETLNILHGNKVYEELESKGAALEEGLNRAKERTRVKYNISRVGSLLTLFFTDHPVIDYSTALASSTGYFKRFFHSMLEDGVYWPPSQFEAVFVSLAHSENDIKYTITKASKAFGLFDS